MKMSTVQTTVTARRTISRLRRLTHVDNYGQRPFRSLQDDERKLEFVDDEDLWQNDANSAACLWREAAVSFTALCSPSTTSPRHSQPPPSVVVAAKAMYVGRACVGAARPWQAGSDGRHPAVGALPVPQPGLPTTATSWWHLDLRRSETANATRSYFCAAGQCATLQTVPYTVRCCSRCVATINICCRLPTLYTVTSFELSAMNAVVIINIADRLVLSRI